jgi:signal transduction histidine kinase
MINQGNIIQHRYLYRLGQQILRFRWYLFFGLGLFVLLFEGYEIFEHPESPPFTDPHVRFEILLYLSVIFTVAFLTEVYVRLLKMHSQALDVLKLKHILSQNFTFTKDWAEVCQQVTQKLGEYGPFEDVLLLVYDTVEGSYQSAASWKAGGAGKSSLHDLSTMKMGECHHRDAYDSNRLKACTCSNMISALDGTGGYCVPIHEGGKPVARLYFRLTPGVKLTRELSHLLENITDEIAVILTTTRLRQKQEEMKIAQSTEELRRIISHDLHDTIGQNLCYLRLKLDLFSQPDRQGELVLIKPELENMRDLANESYELVRGLLVAINPEPSVRLGNLLEYHARLVSERTGLDINVLNQGQPSDLHPETIHQIYFIFREALNNIEKHAHAQRVDVHIIWSEAALQIKIVDDGKGFDPSALPGLGHYGLTTMRERARSLGGRLELSSSIKEGTQVSLWFPLGITVEPTRNTIEIAERMGTR